jgi:hypothetical protein
MHVFSLSLLPHALQIRKQLASLDVHGMLELLQQTKKAINTFPYKQ